MPWKVLFTNGHLREMLRPAYSGSKIGNLINGAISPKFWDKANHQPACIHCNSVKGHKNIKGANGMR